MIEVTNLSKTFKIHEKQPGFSGSLKSLFKRKWVEKHALKKVNLKIEPGEIVGLIGSNGAGKTTLMKILAGIIHPSSGDVKVLGHIPWERENKYRQKISLIMGQKNQLWWDLPASDCFLLLKEIYQIPDDLYKENLDHLVSSLNVSKQLNTQVRRLSLGERMKMEIIAAMLHSPSVIFLDEPTIGLDLPSQRAIREFILEYSAKHKPIIILTSHYMEDIEQLCKRIVVIENGEFIQDGNIDEIISKFHSIKEVIFDTRKIEESILKLVPQTFSPYGEVSNLHQNGFTVHVDPKNMGAMAAIALRDFKVVDMKIKEPGIASVIEKMMKQSQIKNNSAEEERSE